MRLLLALTAILPFGLAVFRDEAYQIDYHHALLGIPEEQNTFFHPPNPNSKASLVYTLSEKSLIGAVNPKDGSIVWRQQLPSAVNSSVALLRPAEGQDVVASATDSDVAAWTASDGRLVWSAGFEEKGQVIGLSFVDHDVLVLFQGAHPVLQRRDGSTGEVKWQFEDTRFVRALYWMEGCILTVQTAATPLTILPSLAPSYTSSLSTAPC
jgi:ER membrane protein complex subunit 1